MPAHLIHIDMVILIISEEYVLWHVDPLQENDHEISDCTTTVAK
jgi:hypothetical protein